MVKVKFTVRNKTQSNYHFLQSHATVNMERANLFKGICSICSIFDFANKIYV